MTTTHPLTLSHLPPLKNASLLCVTRVSSSDTEYEKLWSTGRVCLVFQGRDCVLRNACNAERWEKSVYIMRTGRLRFAFLPTGPAAELPFAVQLGLKTPRLTSQSPELNSE